MKPLVISLPILFCTVMAGCGGGSSSDSDPAAATDSVSTTEAEDSDMELAASRYSWRKGRRDRDNTTTPTPEPTAPTPEPTAPTPEPTAPTPEPTAPTTGTTSGSTSTAYVTIDQVIADMSSPSEAMVIDPRYSWQSKPAVTMYAPRGDAIPSWWTGNRPTWTPIVQSWYTAFEAQGNAATNTRIQMKDLRVYVLSESTRKWNLVEKKTAPVVDLWSYPFSFASGDGGERAESSGGYSIKPVYPRFHHGYGTKTTIVPQDVRAVFVAMDYRLVVADSTKPDDRSKAKYVVDVGGDYYPEGGVMWSEGYAPGIGNGRMVLATPNWRTATMLVPNPNYGSKMDEMRTNPPPLR